MVSYIYLCKKHCHLLCWAYEKNNSFLSFHSSIYHSKKNHKHPACKMNWDEQGGASRKSEVLSEHTFWMTPKSFCCIQDLYFNLQSNTIPYQLNGFIPFSPMKFFSPIHWQTLKILGNGISQSFILSLKCDHPLLCKFSILFYTVKFKLGHKFSQLIHRFNIGILKCWSGAV